MSNKPYISCKLFFSQTSYCRTNTGAANGAGPSTSHVIPHPPVVVSGPPNVTMLVVKGEDFTPLLKVWFGDIESETMYRFVLDLRKYTEKFELFIRKH